MLTGRLLTAPPSISRRPLRSTGGRAPGTAMLARTALVRSPSASTCMMPLSRSVAMARNGIGKRSKSSIPAVGSNKPRNTNPKRCPRTSARGKPNLPWR